MTPAAQGSTDGCRRWANWGMAENRQMTETRLSRPQILGLGAMALAVLVIANDFGELRCSRLDPTSVQTGRDENVLEPFLPPLTYEQGAQLRAAQKWEHCFSDGLPERPGRGRQPERS
jgi:hypothetical protein